MAGLPLYLMAIPLRRSLAAGMGAFKRGGGVYTQLSPAQPSGERMRLACWFRRRAETNFNLISRRRARIEALRESSRSRGRARQHARGARYPDHCRNTL